MNDVSQAPASRTEAGWHATFSPSAAERWIACPGSIAASRGTERTSNKYADEGTCAHALASRCFDYDKPASFWVGQFIVVNDVEWTITDEMAGYVQQYLDDVNARVKDGVRMHEQRVWFSESIGVPDQGGTADAIILSADGKHLTVEDLKYGLGVRVDAEENAQLMTYAVAVLETFSPVMSMDEVEEICLVIHQPRLDHVSEWTCSMDRLHEHAKAMRIAAGRALDACDRDARLEDTSEYFKVTERGCMWCPVKATCEHLRKHVSAIVFDDFEMLEEPETLVIAAEPAVPTGPLLGKLFGSPLEIIEGWCRAVRAEIERQVAAGMDVIGPDGLRMKLVEGKKGRRYWTDEETAKNYLAGILLPQDYLKTSVISPTDAEKKVKKKSGRQTWDDIQAAAVKQAPGKAHVTLGSDPRPPYSAAAGEAEFEELGE